MVKSHDGDLAQLSDEALAALLPDQLAAFTELFHRYRPIAARMATRFTGNTADADDLVQEALMELLETALRYEAERGTAFRTFAVVCMRNRMIAAARRLSKGDHPFVISLDDPSLPQDTLPADDALSPEQLFAGKERAEELRMQMRDVLSGREWEILCLLAGGSSYEEIAQRLQISRKSVDNAIQRARRKLRAVRSEI